LAANIKESSILNNQNIVKVITEKKVTDEDFSFALDFVRKVNINIDKNIYHHIGIYAYKAQTLERFVKLDQSENEIKKKLEQLRAMDNGIKINVALANSSPIGIDTMEDYVALKKILEYKS